MIDLLITQQPAASFFKNNNYYFPGQGNVRHRTNKFTEKGLDLFVKYFKAHFLRIFAGVKTYLVCN